MRLEEVQREFGEGVELTWRSFLLRPEPAARTLDAFVRYTRSWERPASLEPRAQLTPWATQNPPPSHSVPPAVAGKVAATFGAAAFERYHRALLEAYFVDHRTVSEREVLVDVARRAEIDPDEFDDALSDQGRVLERAVWEDHAWAIEHGVLAVPSVVVNDEYLIQGAVDTDVYRRVITAQQ